MIGKPLSIVVNLLMKDAAELLGKPLSIVVNIFMRRCDRINTVS